MFDLISKSGRLLHSLTNLLRVVVIILLNVGIPSLAVETVDLCMTRSG